MPRQSINPESTFDSQSYRFNQALIEDGTLYASGQIGTDGDNVVAGDDLQSQARRAFENIGTILDEADQDYEDITKIRSYMTDLPNHLPEFREVWFEYFEEPPYPCHTTIGVDKLSHIAEGELLIELEFWAELD